MAEVDFIRGAAAELSHISAEMDALVGLSQLDESADSAVYRLGYLMSRIIPRLTDLEERLVRAAA